jgi:hypothetical protein
MTFLFITMITETKTITTAKFDPEHNRKQTILILDKSLSQHYQKQQRRHR